MPKISAPTVAEHRAKQHKQVLDAALRYIVEHEGDVPTLGEVAKDVGLARSSVYQYVSSRADLMGQLLIMLMEEWAAAVSKEMEQVEASSGKHGAALANAKLSAYVRTTLDLFADGTRHAMMVAASKVPSVFEDARVLCAHNVMRPELVAILEKAGLPKGEAKAYADLVDTATHRAAEMIAQGVEREDVIASLDRMIRLS